MLIFTRFLIMSLFLPFLGSRIVPAFVRMGIVFTLSIVTFFYVPSAPVSEVFVFWLFLKEAFLGFLIGFLASLIFYCYQMLGELIDMARGASSARMLIPDFEHQSSPLGLFFFQLALLIFISLGLHRPFLQFAFKSFLIFPPLELFALKPTPLDLMSYLWESALSLAMPVMFICFILDLAFGFLNRIAPQINAYFLSLPLKTIGGLMMVFISLPMLIDDFLIAHEKLLEFLKTFLTTGLVP